MNLLSKTIGLLLLLIPVIGNSQSAEIINLDEKNACQYKSYYEDGSIKSIVGFYAKKPYSSVKSFESKLKDYNVKYHGEVKEFYPNGQLKEIVVYKKGKVIEFAKNYFEDGEECVIVADKIPVFQFELQDQKRWFDQKVSEIESKYEVDLEGNGFIALEISKEGLVKAIKVRVSEKKLEKYLIEIGEQIVVDKPAIKNNQNVGTKFGFRVSL